MNSSLTSLLSLTVMSVIYVNAVSGIERLRLSVSRRHVSSMLGVFTFAAVVALPLPHLLLLVVGTYVVAWPTFRRAGQPRGRYTYSGAAVATSAGVGSLTYDTFGHGVTGLAAAMLTYTFTNTGLIAAAIAAARQREAWQHLRRPQLYGLLTLTQTIGAGIGVAVLWNPYAGIAGLPVAFVVHIRSTRATVEATGACVGGIWNRTGWLALAEEAHRAGERFTVMLVELPDPLQLRLGGGIVQARLGQETLGWYSDTRMVVLLRESCDASARLLAVRLTVALRNAGLNAGVGVDSQAESVAGMLALAAGEAIIHRSRDDAAPELH